MTDGGNARYAYYPAFGADWLAVSSAVLRQPYRCSHRCWKQAEIPNWFSNIHPPPWWTTRTTFSTPAGKNPEREEGQLKSRDVLNIRMPYQKICPSGAVAGQIAKRAERPMLR